VFTAPADVSISPVPRYVARIRVELRPPQRRFDRAATLQVVFGLREEAAWSWTRTCSLGAGAAIGDIDTTAVLDVDADFDAPSGTLTWSGVGLLDGSAPFRDLSDTTRTPIDARIELDPKQDLPPARPDESPTTEKRARELSVRVSNIGIAGGEDVACHALDKDGGEYEVNLQNDGTGTLAVDEARWLAAWHGSLVSEWIDLGTTPAAAAHLELAPGGFLVVVPANLPPPSLGTPRLERQDGRPFLLNEGGACGTSWDMSAGLVIGPLRPGTVTFRVTLGGRVLASATAEVRAGTYETLRIPRLRTQ
jgi:hypothetical protein